MLNAMTADSHPRQISRPNSTSSSSTVRRAASLSSQPGSRSGRSKAYNANSAADPLIPGTTPVTSSRSEGRHRKRPSEAHYRSSSTNGAQDDLANGHRWSQSTTSSKNSVTSGGPGQKRRNSFSRRLSISNSSTFGFAKPFTIPDSPPQRNVLTKSRTSPGKVSQSKSSRAKSAGPRTKIDAALPKIPRNPSSSSQAVLTLDTTPVLTPSTFTSISSDYFGISGDQVIDDSQWKPKYLSSRTPIHIAAATVTIPANTPSEPLEDREQVIRGHSRHRGHNTKGSDDTEAGSSISSTRSGAERGRKHKSPTQKTMLSRALQKANTAVLLDNAQNFEGAIDAYADACHLLQQVMQGSTGGEDRKKLEAIVGAALAICGWNTDFNSGILTQTESTNCRL
jgi:MIT (microtubule interacting and transport) domain